MKQFVCCVALGVAVLLSQPLFAQPQPPDRSPARDTHPLRLEGSRPVEPFRVMGNVFYVGAQGISAHIISSNDGLILLDTGTTQMHAGIRASIEKLGFRWQDIKIILSSHAHWDHVEGHSEMQAVTGAEIVAVGEDAAAIASGVDNSAIGAAGWTAAEVGRVLKDGDVVQLGEVTMRAHLTAGHTKGCTTWTTTAQERGQTYLVVFVGGTSINQGVRLLENRRHPSIVEDYARTFRILKEIRADVFLAQHPAMYDMAGKRRRMKNGAERNPFIDPTGYQDFVRGEEAKFVAQLQQESAGN